MLSLINERSRHLAFFEEVRLDDEVSDGDSDSGGRDRDASMPFEMEGEGVDALMMRWYEWRGEEN